MTTLDVSTGTTTIDIPVTITGTAEVTDMSAYVQIGDGGSVLGNPTDGPMITGVSYAGSIWEAAEGGFTTFFAGPDTTSPSQVIEPQVVLNTSGQSVPASGTLFTLNVDLSGVSDTFNSFLVLLSNPELGATTAFQNMDGILSTNLVDGSINVIIVPADMDGDADVDFDDIDDFVLALNNAVEYESIFGLSPDLVGDTDGDGDHDFDDILGFIVLLTGAGGFWRSRSNGMNSVVRGAFIP